MASNFNPEVLKNTNVHKDIVAGQNKLEQTMAENGVLGKIWGVPTSIPYNVTALIIILLILTGITYTLCCFNQKSTDLTLSITGFWGIITPLITLGMGYLFGKGKKQKS